MNFTFKITDLYKLLVDMKNEFVILTTIAGIHTFSLLCYFSYKYFNETFQTKNSETNVKHEINTDIETDIDMYDIDEDIKKHEMYDINSCVEIIKKNEQAQDIQETQVIIEKNDNVIKTDDYIEIDKINIDDNIDIDEKELYNTMSIFDSKKNELSELVDKLSKIEISLQNVREKLGKLNT